MPKYDLRTLLSPGIVLYRHADIPRFSPQAADVFFGEVLHISGKDARYTVYDPFCGNGINAATLQALYFNVLSRIIGSDQNVNAVGTTKENLRIVSSSTGIVDRIIELECQYKRSGKESIARRAGLAQELCEYVKSVYPVPYEIFQANVFGDDLTSRIEPGSIDIVFTDPPHCKLSPWVDGQGSKVAQNLIENFLNTLLPFLGPNGIFALMLEIGNGGMFKGYNIVKTVELRKRTGYILVPT